MISSPFSLSLSAQQRFGPQFRRQVGGFAFVYRGSPPSLVGEAFHSIRCGNSRSLYSVVCLCPIYYTHYRLRRNVCQGVWRKKWPLFSEQVSTIAARAIYTGSERLYGPKFKRLISRFLALCGPKTTPNTPQIGYARNAICSVMWYPTTLYVVFARYVEAHETLEKGLF